MVYVNAQDAAPQPAIEALRGDRSVATVPLISSTDVKEPVVTKEHVAAEMPLLAIELMHHDELGIEIDLAVDNAEA